MLYSDTTLDPHMESDPNPLEGSGVSNSVGFETPRAVNGAFASLEFFSWMPRVPWHYGSVTHPRASPLSSERLRRVFLGKIPAWQGRGGFPQIRNQGREWLQVVSEVRHGAGTPRCPRQMGVTYEPPNLGIVPSTLKPLHIFRLWNISAELHVDEQVMISYG